MDHTWCSFYKNLSDLFADDSVGRFTQHLAGGLRVITECDCTFCRYVPLHLHGILVFVPHVAAAGRECPSEATKTRR